MIERFHHQEPPVDGRATTRQGETPTNSASQATSGVGSLHGWRCCASAIAVMAILTLFGAADAAQLSLTWTDASTNEDGFKIERATGTAGAYGQVASVAAGTTGYVDATVTAGSTYCYRVRAYNTAGDSAYSNAACATPASATPYTVTVGKVGAGSGTVASSPSAIDCGSTCSASIACGTSLALSATPTTGSTFSGWSGACTGTGSCTLVVDAAKSLTATFAVSTPATYALTVTKSGTGTGTVTAAPSGISCGSTCSASFSSGTSVTLAAAAGTGSTFAGWTGACTGTGTCTVSMTQAQTVTAAFAAQTFTLTVTPSGTGSGTVTSNPTGVTCGTDCTETYAYNTSVTLTAAASSGSTFTGWGGACTGTGTCTVSMTAARSVTATFGAASQTPSSYLLTVTQNGVGTGMVASNPAGINCGTACSASFTSGAAVTLTAMPDAGSTFAGWGGSCTGAGSCTVSMSQLQTVTATFAPQSVALTVTEAGTGFGTVKSSPAGIDCATTCSAAFSAGTVVSLGATPAKNSAFAGWSGACAGTGACTVALTQAKSVTATFNKKGRK